MIPTGPAEAVAKKLKGFVEAGMRVPKIMDYSGMAGTKFAMKSAAKVRAAEDELMRLCNDGAAA